MPELDLEGRVALVTGGGSGIGAATAEMLGARGAVVVVNDIDVDAYGRGPGGGSAAATAERIRDAGGTALATNADVTDRAAVAAVVEQVEREHGSVDVLVCCAGVIGASLASATEADWDRVLGVHVGGHLACIDAVLPGMARRGWGRIVAVTSGAGHIRAGAGQELYGTAKRAIAGLTWIGGQQMPDGVTLNALSPIAATQMVAASAGGRPGAGDSGAGGGSDTTFGGQAAPALDLSALPAPTSLMPLVRYLTSETSQGLSGQVLYTNGTEVSVIGAPALVEAVHRTVWASGATLRTAVETFLVPAAERGPTGGGMPVALPAGADAAPPSRCVLVAAPGVVAPLAASWRNAGWEITEVDPGLTTGVFEQAAATLAAQRDAALVVVASPPLGGDVLSPDPAVLDELRLHAAWAKGVMEVGTHAPRRLVHAISSAGSPRSAVVAMAVHHLAHCLAAAGSASPDFAADVCDAWDDAATTFVGLASTLATSPAATALAGAELELGADWIGVRSHPRVVATFPFGSGVDDAWMDRMVRAALSG